MTVTAFKPRIVASPRIAQRIIPERLAERHYGSGHVLRINHGHLALILRVKTELEL